MIINNFKLSNIPLFLHNLEKSNHNSRDWPNHNLFLALLLSIYNSFKAISQDIHFNHSLQTNNYQIKYKINNINKCSITSIIFQYTMNLLQVLSSTITPQQPKFKQIYTPQQRWKKHLNIVKGNPNHVSVVIQPKLHSNFRFKKPYLLLGLEKGCSIAELNANIRHILALEEKQALFLYCGKILPSGHERIKNLERFIEPDGFLYFTIGDHEVYG